MSKIIKRKVGLIIPGDDGVVMMFYPPASNDGCPFKLFHCLTMNEIKAYDIRPNDVISLEVKGPNLYKFIGVDLSERTGTVEQIVKVDAAMKAISREERMQHIRVAISGLKLLEARDLLDDVLDAAQDEAVIPVPEGSDTDGSTKNVRSSKS